MSKPWDAPPFPTSGDSEDRLTYEGVGRVMTGWECVEFDLSRLYSVLIGDGELIGPGIQMYGEGRIFQDRARALRIAAHEQYFVAHSDQELEGQFAQIVEAVEGFSDRRNEAAHGIVMPVQNLTFFVERHFGQKKGGKAQFLLIPPLYTVRKHNEGLPKYAYSSLELRQLADNLIVLSQHVSDYRKRLIAQRGWPQARP